MDVLKPHNSVKKIDYKKYKFAIGGAIAAIILLVWIFQSAHIPSVSRNEILIDKVHEGALDVVVEGYGTLKSNKQQLISSLSQATVKEIILKPGARVTANSIVLRMENPEVNQEVESAKLQLTQSQSNFRQLKLSQKRELLDETSKLEEYSSQLEKVTLKRTAYETLSKRGIVSGMDFQQTILDEQLLKKQLDILKQRVKGLTQVHEEALAVEQDRVKQQQSVLAVAQSRLDALVVHAGIDGVLQRLSVELGQTVGSGQEIALIGSMTDLVALIRVPQSEAQTIAVGQNATVTTRGDEIKGKVARIDPVVKDNTVEIEISLPEQLPPSAIPQSNVDAKITTDMLAHVVYLKRPAKIQSNTQGQLYALDNNQKSAQIKTIKFGKRAGDYIQILSGVNVNDNFIISDLSNIKTTSSRLRINN